MEALAKVPTNRGAMIEEEVVGHRVGWFPGSRLLFAEGHPNVGGLGGRDSLAGAFEAVSEGLEARGIIAPRYKLKQRVREDGPETDLDRRIFGGTGFAGVRRLDSTVDIRYDDPLEGQAVLKGISQLSVPRMKLSPMHATGSRKVETVEMRGWSGKRLLGRVYDKGVHPDTLDKLPRGAWVRPEDQRRYSSGTRLPLEAVTETSYIRDAFVRRFETLWQASKGVTVAGAPQLVKDLEGKVESGEMTGRQALTVLGHLVWENYGEQRQHRSTISRQRRLVREHGLVLTDNPDDEVQISLGSVLEEALDCSAWGIG